MNWLAFFPDWPMISYCIMLSENRNRCSESMMRSFKVLQRPLRVRQDALRCKVCAPGRTEF